MKLSPQERQRRRDLALRLHREGRLGTRAHQSAGGKAKARRASQLAQQLVEDNRGAIERTLREILRDGTPAQKLRATEALLKLGLAAERLDVSEHRDEQQHRSREELISLLADKLNGGSLAGQLVRARLAENAIDGEAVEIS